MRNAIFRPAGCLAACALAIASLPAAADLMSVDSDFGTDTLTLDTATGLHWLDLTLTVDRTVNDISAELGAGGEFEGYRYASLDEITELWLGAGIVDITTLGPIDFANDFTVANFDAAIALSEFFGVTIQLPSGPVTEGFTNTESATAPGELVIGELNICTLAFLCNSLGASPDSALASLGPNTDTADTAISFAGHWLVQVDAADADDDGVADSADNCIDVANADQRDSNGDGFGNVCDADLDGDCTINFNDLSVLKAAFFTSAPDEDLNGDGDVNFADLGLMKDAFFGEPGPSALASCQP